MWNCKKCGEVIEDQFDSCWKCRSPKSVAQSESAESAKEAEEQRKWRLAFKFFRGGPLELWDDLFEEAAQFATEIGPERLVNISHSDSHKNGVVTVWYWTGAEEPDAPLNFPK